MPVVDRFRPFSSGSSRIQNPGSIGIRFMQQPQRKVLWQEPCIGRLNVKLTPNHHSVMIDNIVVVVVAWILSLVLFFTIGKGRSMALEILQNTVSTGRTRLVETRKLSGAPLRSITPTTVMGRIPSMTLKELMNGKRT